MFWGVVIILGLLLGIWLFLPATKERSARDTKVGEDTSEMVSVPAGDFFMGCNEKVDTECDDDEKPGRTVNLPAFSIDKTEVTVAQFAKCVEAGKCSSRG